MAISTWSTILRCKYTKKSDFTLPDCLAQPNVVVLRLSYFLAVFCSCRCEIGNPSPLSIIA